MATQLNPLIFQILHGLLGDTPYGTVLEYIAHEGEQALIDFGRTRLMERLGNQSEAITKKMIKDGWEVGKPHPKTGQPLTQADLGHDLPYRLVRAANVPGGLIRDTIRDATDHALGAGLVSSVPPTPTVEWVQSVIAADVQWWVSLVPQV